MTRTLRFGYDSSSPRIASRIDRFVVRRHTGAAYTAAQNLAAEDYAFQVAKQVTPTLAAPQRIVGGIPQRPFGKR